MPNAQYYDSPLGRILLAADEQGLTGLWFEGQRYFPAGLAPIQGEGTPAALDDARRWLDIYFQGRAPDFTPALHLQGTAFRLAVWRQLLSVPYGTTVTYGALARQLGLPTASSRAVGGAVGHNPVSLMVPCHRVIGADGSLTGYAGGTDRKRYLLQAELPGQAAPCSR